MSFARLLLRDVRSLVGLGFTPIGGVFFVLGLYFLQTQIRLAKHGVEAEAMVTDKRISTSRDSDGDTSYQYMILFEFQTASERTFTSDASVAKRLYNRTSIGDKIMILYDPADPDTNAVKADKTRFILPGAFTGLGGLFVLIGLALLAVGWRGARRVSAILKRGMEAVGRITGIERNTSIAVNGRHVYFIIEYDFEDHARTRRHGSDSMVHEKIVEPLALSEGIEVPIKFLPTDPEQSAVDVDMLRSLAGSRASN